ncbi:ROK family protein [Paenibacillus campinasensis]|uniref:ROK family protein n=1 Tax=Paenibacillus campinasensis TaxID=66347 RepID=A0A268ETC7_9BACL|nr:ROK family protein [Paenibacillus campinasensis]PAD76385.1 hypothetical protein CHH67_12210 [Paenibacillus campinasensis]
MMRDCVLALDVGGTFIKGAAVWGNGEVAKETLLYRNTNAQGARDAVLDQLHAAVKELAVRAKAVAGEDGIRVQGIGLAFPGPFDYESGISYLQGLGKFDALYGVNVRDELADRADHDPKLVRMGFRSGRIFMENDAYLFARGEAVYGAAASYKRAVCMTLGTGFGTGFILDGAVIREGDGVPANGWLYNASWADGIVDDCISRRGMLHCARSLGFDVDTLDVKELAALAESGERSACALFEHFGHTLGAVLVRYTRAFNPEAYVLGGQIANASPLFVPALACELERGAINAVITKSPDTLLSTFRGIKDYVFGQYRSSGEKGGA